MSCAECEAMLTDFIDGTLSAKDKAAFDLHIATCKECSQMLADAQRGAALLEMLKSSRPEPSASLLDRILTETSGIAAQASASQPNLLVSRAIEAVPAGLAPVLSTETLPLVAGTPISNVIPFRPRPASRFNLQAIGRNLMQPRLAMTAAMAFFSIALTLNLTGVHLNELRAGDLKPSSLKHTFYQADASLTRYYENLRVVYELESRLRDLRQSNDSDNPDASAKPDSKGSDSRPNATPDPGKNGTKSDQQRKSPKAGSGTSQRSNPQQPEFKLVWDRSGALSSRSQGMITAKLDVSPKYNNKSKEVLQEGGSV